MRPIRSAIMAAIYLLIAPIAWAAPPLDWMIELTVRGQRIEGAPVPWTPREVGLLTRDGQIRQFAPEEAADYRETSDWFRGYSPSALRSMLLRELGSGFEVSGTGHYMVAHP